MKPWFEREADIIKFPEPEAEVIKLPDVAQYPDFITGVQDLKAKLSTGKITQEIHNKLYTDLIHRFMRKESAETPWFLREAIGALVGQELFKPNRIDNGLPRYNKFLQKVINKEPFAAKKNYKDKTEIPFNILIDPKEKNNISNWIKKNDPNQPLTLKTDKGSITIKKTSMNPVDLLKGPEFGGQQFTGQSGGKESKLVKISDIGLADTDIPVKNLGDLLINNKILNQSKTGKVIINMVKNIMGGNPQINEKLDASQLSALRDYGGEYLGILMIIKGLADFPNQQPFYKHLNIKSLDELVVNFPSKSNNPLADGFGKIAGFRNKKDKFTINISIKGGASGKGAAPALSNFKVPDEFRKRKEFAQEIEFIDTNDNKEFNQYTFPFALLNVIQKHHADKIPEYIKNFLPFTNIPKVTANDIMKQSKTGIIQKIYKNVAKEFLDKTGRSKGGKKPLSEFHVVHYAIEKAVEIALSNGALPDLSPLFREMLQQNFIQVSNTFKNNAFQTSVLWPNTDLASGNVVYDSKNSMQRIASKACIRIL